jgi:hypothetical protein
MGGLKHDLQPAIRERDVRTVELRYRGAKPKGRVVVMVPVAINTDIITYRGQVFVRRSGNLYQEASVWPILEGLDADH